MNQSGEYSFGNEIVRQFSKGVFVYAPYSEESGHETIERILSASLKKKKPY